MDVAKVDSYSEYIKELMYEFNGTIISGGTEEGIPGLVGRIKEELNKEKPVGFELIAYLPGQLPDDANVSAHYDKIYKTESEEFSAFEILTTWTDIILSGIQSSEVIVIGIDGGDIADLEYRIALSLGAKVCLVDYSGRAVSDFVQEKRWKDHSNLVRVPNDPFTVWALINQKVRTDLTENDINKLAPEVHEFYRQKRLKEFDRETNDIDKLRVVMEWDYLKEDFKFSNKQQVSFYQAMLERVDLSIRPSKDLVLFDIKKNLSDEKYDMLAKLEHARWNAERLLAGWKYGPVKDIFRKINPCLVPWDDLDSTTKPNDYEPVDNIPRMLKEIGYEVY
jgi:hypothetical protein